MTAKPVRFVCVLALGLAAAAGAKAQETGKTKDSAQTGKAAPKAPGPASVAPKDQAIDDLLGKLGESKDEPAQGDRPRNQGGGAGEQPKEQGARAKGSSAKLG